MDGRQLDAAREDPARASPAGRGSADDPSGPPGSEPPTAPGRRPPVAGGADDLVIPAPPWLELQPRRARRSARPPLDRDQIVDAALRIVDAEGVESLSLRRLAETLGVTPMSIYWHVKDKAELLELVGHAVLAEITVPAPAGDWREQLADAHRAMLEAFRRHPNTVEVLVGRARYGPAGLMLFERILSILLEAGLSPEAAFDAYTSLYEFTLGFMAMSSRSPAFVAMQQQGVGYLRSLPSDRFPAIAIVAPVIGRRSLQEQFELGLQIQIEGIASCLTAKVEGQGRRGGRGLDTAADAQL